MNEGKKWEMFQQVLAAGIHGDDPRPLVSKRTLFGIKSSVEEQMDAIAAEMEQRSASPDATGSESGQL